MTDIIEREGDRTRDAMTPTTEAGAFALRFLLDAGIAFGFKVVPDGAAKMIAAIEAEAARAEAAHWHRMPGTYRTDDATEIVVDLPESLSWLEDEFPDEVNAATAALTALRERVAGLVAAVEEGLDLMKPVETCRVCEYTGDTHMLSCPWPRLNAALTAAKAKDEPPPIHVYPVGEGHQMSEDCWCRPRVETAAEARAALATAKEAGE